MIPHKSRTPNKLTQMSCLNIIGTDLIHKTLVTNHDNDDTIIVSKNQENSPCIPALNDGALRRISGKLPGIGWASLGQPDDLQNRNYDTFSILANVRNGYGFAGHPTGEGFNPISKPRGLPEDITKDIQSDSDDMGDDGHSHSWLTLREVLHYDYLQVTTHTGILNFEAFKQFEKYRKYNVYSSPTSWCADVSGNEIVIVTDDEACEIIALNNTNTDTSKIYVKTTWKRRYLDDISHFSVNLIPYIQYGLDDIRLVFWFDN